MTPRPPPPPPVFPLKVMSTGNLVKIGVVGKSEFFSFEACDDLEAAAVSKALGAAKHSVALSLLEGSGRSEGDGRM